MSARLDGRMRVEYEYDPHPKRGHRTRRGPPLDGNGPMRSGEAAGQIPPPPRRQTGLLCAGSESPCPPLSWRHGGTPMLDGTRQAAPLPQWTGNLSETMALFEIFFPASS
jgi:hypothetical protein